MNSVFLESGPSGESRARVIRTSMFPQSRTHAKGVVRLIHMANKHN